MRLSAESAPVQTANTKLPVSRPTSQGMRPNEPQKLPKRRNLTTDQLCMRQSSNVLPSSKLDPHIYQDFVPREHRPQMASALSSHRLQCAPLLLHPLKTYDDRLTPRQPHTACPEAHLRR